jgi:hypothetical protein
MKQAVKLRQFFTLSIAEDKYDKQFRKVMFSTTVDLCRLGEVQSNFLLRAYMASFKNASELDYRLKMMKWFSS